MDTVHLVAAALVLAAIAAPAAAAGPLGGPERYLLAFEGSLPADVIPGASFARARVVARHDAIGLAVVDGYPEGALLDPRIRYIERDDARFGRLALVPDDPLFPHLNSYGARRIGAEAAWDRTTGSTAVKVAMIDSGAHLEHEDLAGPRLLSGWDFAHGDAAPEDEAGCKWHGSHTAGLAGATLGNARGIAGISQHAILPIKAFSLDGADCTASESALVGSLLYAAEQGAHVSSNSWSGGVSLAVRDAIRAAHDRGVVHVAAAGNAGPCSMCVGDPWKSSGVVTLVVSATNSVDGQAIYSSEGPEVDLAAPGTALLSLCGPAPDCYVTRTGTSMAAPLVSGAVALLKALHPEYGFADIEGCLKTTALDVGVAGPDAKFGHGRLRLDAALACERPAFAPAEELVYEEGFEAVTWSASSPLDLWHAGAACVAPSGARHLAWTVPSACTYAAPPGLDHAASSPPIDLREASSATLRFRHLLDHDVDPAGGDAFLVEAAPGCGATWEPLARWDGRDREAAAWTWVALDLDRYAGDLVCLRLHVIGGGTAGTARMGWFVDDVAVAAG